MGVDLNVSFTLEVPLYVSLHLMVVYIYGFLAICQLAYNDHVAIRELTWK